MSFHTEEEQLLELKNFFLRYKNIFIVSLLVIAIAAGSLLYWKNYTKKYNQRASDLYQKIIHTTKATNKTSEKNKQDIKIITQKLQEEYSKTPYAVLSTFLYVKQLINDHNYTDAKLQLTWVITNNKNEAFIVIAKQRIARILITESPSNTDEALSLIESIPEAMFDSSVAELIGDIYYNNNSIEKAHLAYNQAKTLAKNSEINILLERKIENSHVSSDKIN